MKKYLKQYGLLLQNNLLTNILKTVLLFTLLAAVSSCTVDDTSDPTDPIDKFLGTWNVSDQAARINYAVTIQRDPNHSAYVLLNNFADMGGNAKGLVVGDNIIIETQDIGNDFLCSGTGTYKTKYELEFLFMLDDGIETEQRKAVFSR